MAVYAADGVTLVDLIRDAALLGYAIGTALVALALAVIMLTLTTSRRDDGYSPIGASEPPPPRTSPFAPPVARGESGRSPRGGGAIL